MPMPQRGPQGASTRSADTSPVNIAFHNMDPETPGVVSGSPEELRKKFAAASRKVWPQTNHEGVMTGITTSDSLKAGPRMTCERCGASAAILVNDQTNAGHLVCVSCGKVPELAYPAAGVVIPQTKEHLEPTHAMDDRDG